MKGGRNRVKNGYIKQGGIRTWYKNWRIHRDNGPAIILANGSEIWFRHGSKHREGGPAAIYKSDRFKEWYKKTWYKRGKVHREDGPAIINAWGNCIWFYRGKRVQPKENALIIWEKCYFPRKKVVKKLI